MTSRSRRAEGKKEETGSLDAELDARGSRDDLRVRLERRLDPLLEERVHLLRRSPDERLGVEAGRDETLRVSPPVKPSPSGKKVSDSQLVQLGHDVLEVRIPPDPLDQIILPSLLLHDGARLMAQHPDLLMGLLPVPSLLHDLHDDVLGRHERQLLVDSSSDDFRVDDEALKDVLEGGEDDVGGEEGLGEGHSTVGRVVESALEPLDRVGHERVLGEDHEVPGEGADTLGSHRVLGEVSKGTK
jgi:hypothetical protein